MLVQLSYAIGVSHPLSIFIDTYGTGLTRSQKTDLQITEIVKSNFDLRPGALIRCVVCILLCMDGLVFMKLCIECMSVGLCVWCVCGWCLYVQFVKVVT